MKGNCFMLRSTVSSSLRRHGCLEGGRRIRFGSVATVVTASSYRTTSSSSYEYERRQEYGIQQSSRVVRFTTSTKHDKPPPEEEDETSSSTSTTTSRRNTQYTEKKETTSSTSSTALSHFLQQLQSPPNLITTARIAAAPLLCYWIVTDHTTAACLGCVVAGASDALDGYLAKHYHMSTVLGTYLDPLADKILINSLSVSLWYTAILPGPLVTLWLCKDVGLMIATYRHVYQQSQKQASSSVVVVWDPLTTPLKINPTLISKINTAFQFITVGIALIPPTTMLFPMNDLLLSPLCWLTGTTTILSVMSYVGYDGFLKSDNDETIKDGTTSSTTATTSSSASMKEKDQRTHP